MNQKNNKKGNDETEKNLKEKIISFIKIATYRFLRFFGAIIE